MSEEGGDPLLCPHCGGTHPIDRLRCPETDEILPLGGRMLDGKFRFIEQIGKGGMASVWSARNLNVDKEVAIKLIRPEVARNSENVARFRAEARAAGRIGHRNICDIHDLGFSPIGPYIVMERLEGQSVGELLREEGPLESTRVVDIAVEALSGLEAAHQAGIVHRDLKPENLFLHRSSGAPSLVKVMDFGVSKFTDGSADAETGTGALLGTPEYMAPEQVQGAALVDARTDIWAIGVVLYEMLSGVSPFKGPTVASSLLMVTVEEPASLASLVPDLPPGLVDVVERCIRRDPAERFSSAAALASELSPFGSAALRPTVAVETRAAASGLAPRERSRWPRVAIVAGVATVLGLVFVVEFGFTKTPVAEETAEAVRGEGDEEEDRVSEVEPPVEREERIVAAGLHANPNAEPPPVEVAPEPQTPLEPQTPPPSVPIEPVPVVVPEAPKKPLARVDNLVTPVEPPPISDLGGARRACEALRAINYEGHSTWKLANPSLTRKFEGHAEIKKGRYWTSAVHSGAALVINLPEGGDASRVKLGQKAAHPMCVAEAR